MAEGFMQTNSRFFDDLARVASGAASTLAGVRQELDAMVRQRLERLMSDMDLVTRDEFEAVKATAANARAEQEMLAGRVMMLEEKLAASASGAPDASPTPEGSEQPPPEDH
jgi:BMFP domain-containing protein YqiC